jgi:hypothetical protein
MNPLYKRYIEKSISGIIVISMLVINSLPVYIQNVYADGQAQLKDQVNIEPNTLKNADTSINTTHDSSQTNIEKNDTKVPAGTDKVIQTGVPSTNISTTSESVSAPATSSSTKVFESSSTTFNPSTTIDFISNATPTVILIPVSGAGNFTTSGTSTVGTTTQILPMSGNSITSGTSTVGTTTQILPVSGSGNFITSGTSTVGTTTQIIPTPALDDTNLATSTHATSSDVLTNHDVSSSTGALPNGTTTITTGDAVAMASILNIVNTNLTNSTGSIILANVFDGHSGDVDLRTKTGQLSAGGGCTLLACNGIDGLTVKIHADAAINNIITVVATSGENIIDTAGNAIIHTGNTYAGLNLVNIANTTLVDSNYLLLSLNAFHTLNGDIVFPSLYDFFSNYSSSTVSNVHTELVSDITNNVNVGANSGNNTTINTALGTIDTGDTHSSTGIFNNLNSSLLNDNSLLLLLKVSGNWHGELIGTPLGSSFTGSGSTRVLELHGNEILGSQQESASGSLGNTLSPHTTDTNEKIIGTSTAKISNIASVFSDSGNNKITDASTSRIETGNSYAGLNLINIANANVIGRNWILGIINIFGDFNGNIAFGRPELWLGEQVHAQNTQIGNGSTLTYTITVINKGDRDAVETKVSSHYDANHLVITDSSIPYVENKAGVLVFDLPSLTTNVVKEIIYHAIIQNTTPGTNIVNTSVVTMSESDNLSNNTDSTTITTSIPQASGGEYYPTITPILPPPTIPSKDTITISPLDVSIERVTASTTIIGQGIQGNQLVIIRNTTGNTLSGIIFNDVVHDKNGKEVHMESFDVGDFLPHEEIRLTYTVSFGPEAEEGVYPIVSEVEYVRNKVVNKLLTMRSGSIVYSPLDKPIALSIHATSTVLDSTHATTIQRSIKGKENFLSAFLEPITPQIAYAKSENYSPSDTSSFRSFFPYITLSFVIIISSLYFRHRRLIVEERR